MKRLGRMIGEKDKIILSALHQLRNKKYLALLMRFFSFLGGATFSIGVVLILLFITQGESRRAAGVAALSLTASHLLVRWLKGSIKRFRPYLAIKEWKVFGKPLRDHSFPSGHTTSIFSIVTPFAFVFPTVAFLMYLVAITVGFSRVYLGFHYPSDVIAGIVIGVSVSLSSQFMLYFLA